MAFAGEKMITRPNCVIRRMNASDGPSAHAILKESPEASTWSFPALLESVSRGIAWVAELDRHIVGVLVGRVVADQFEILNLAIGRAYRRLGIGSQLARSALEHAQAVGAPRAFLEVRASNQGAIALYEQIGFRCYGRRANYYHDPVEDALMLVWHRDEISL